VQLNAVHLPLSLSRGIIASKAQSTIPMQERTAKIHSTHMFKTERFLCAQTVPSSLQSRPGFPSYEMGHNIISPTMSPAPYPSSSCGDFLTHPTPTPPGASALRASVATWVVCVVSSCHSRRMHFPGGRAGDCRRGQVCRARRTGRCSEFRASFLGSAGNRLALLALSWWWLAWLCNRCCC